MNITNLYNLPASIVKAIYEDDYVRVGDYSSTGLIRPVQMAALEYRYADQITEDASEGLWRLLGKSMHAILEKGNHAASIVEGRLQIKVGNLIVSAKPDLYHIQDKSIDDYKVTSSFAFSLNKSMICPKCGHVHDD